MRKKHSKVGEEWFSKNVKQESKRTGNGYRKHKNDTLQQVQEQRNESDRRIEKGQEWKEQVKVEGN